MTEQQLEKVVLDENFNPIIVTPGQYRFFLAHGKEGLEALQLYMHLQFTARMQETNQVYANNEYLKNGLCIGDVKLKSLKAFLKKYGFIEYVQERNPVGTKDEEGNDISGCMGKQYIRLKYIHKADTIERMLSVEKTGGTKTVPAVQKTAPAVNRPTGSREQMLKERNSNSSNSEVNALNEEGREEGVGLAAYAHSPSQAAATPSPLPSISQVEKKTDYSDFETIYRRHTSYPLFSKSTGESHRAALQVFIEKHGRTLALKAFEAFTDKRPGKDLKYFCVDGDEGEKIIADMVKPEKAEWVDYLYDSLDYEHFRKLCGFSDSEGTKTIHEMLKGKHPYAWDFVNEAVKKCGNDPQKIRDYLFSTEKYNEWLRIQIMCGDKPVRKHRLKPGEWVCPICGKIATGSTCYGKHTDEKNGNFFACNWNRADNTDTEKLSAAQADFTMFKRDPVAYAEKTRQESERVKKLMDEFRAKHAEAAA